MRSAAIRSGFALEDATLFDTWTWVHAAGSVELSEGTNTLILRIHEGGLAINQIRLTRE